MKILSSKIHGCLDYITVALFLIAPTLFGFSGVPAVIAYIIAVVHLILTITTAFESGLSAGRQDFIKIIPLPLHGIIEFVVSLLLIILPWLFGFSEVIAARNFYIGIGVVIFIIYFITNYNALIKLNT